ncbi:ASCH domain-containing protein [Thermogladius sp. 4427co]|uniref:ASCH domain-containing protein n=1 Tax=Thermogladius sp. 4427co TaxID=3450718 RepID=UPI003F7A317F
MVGPKKFLGRHIIIREDYAERFLKGEKTTTVRRGIVKVKYRNIIIHTGIRPLAIARVEYVYHKMLKNISEEEARKDGFRSREEFIREIRKLYPDIDENEYVTVIGLRILKRLDVIDSRKPFGGLKPADLARIGLRYLGEELSEIERKILLDLTRTGDIDLTSQRVLKDVGRRGVVVEVLNNVLRRLLDKGILREKRGD